jgi:hypothetical protein
VFSGGITVSQPMDFIVLGDLTGEPKTGAAGQLVLDV